MTEELIKELLQKQANDIVKNFPVANPPEGFKWKAILEVTFPKDGISWHNKWVAEPI